MFYFSFLRIRYKEQAVKSRKEERAWRMEGIIMIGGACGLVLLIAAMRSKTELLLNFILRCVLGTLAIYFINAFLDAQGFPGHVGIGAASVIVCGTLGFRESCCFMGSAYVPGFLDEAFQGGIDMQNSRRWRLSELFS